MKIVLATPLYPPDIAEPAPYVKELAKRLSQKHEITIVAYGRLPEEVQGVRIIAVDKRRPLVLRLFRYTFALWSALRKADVIYAQNGASVELPVAIIVFFTRRPLVIGLGDRAAHEVAKKNFIRRTIERFAMKKAWSIVTDMPLERPEILPFGSRPDEALAAYETSWRTHLHNLEKTFADAK